MLQSVSRLDIVTISIALVALIVSVITLVKQFFYKKFAFNGCLIQYFSAQGAFEAYNFEYSLANTGNVILVIKEVLIDPVNPPINLTSPILNIDNIPNILKPEQMLMIKFSLSKLLVNKAALKKFKIKVTFLIVSPKGRIYYVPQYLNFSPKKELNVNDWKPFKLKTRKHRIS